MKLERLRSATGGIMADTSDANVEPIKSPEDKRYDRSKVRLARMSWLIPLASFGIWIIIYSIVANTSVEISPLLYNVVLVIFVTGVVIGFVLSVLSLVQSSNYQGMIGHAIGGLVITIALALLTTVAVILAKAMLLSGLAR
jgi:hypothetical protein